MSKIKLEEIQAIVTDPTQFGYEEFALTDIDQYSELELRQYQQCLIVCLMIENGILWLAIIPKDNEVKDSVLFFLQAISNMSNSDFFPKEKIINSSNPEAMLARAKLIAEEGGIPMAIISLFENQRGELLTMFDTLPGVDPKPILGLFAKTAARRIGSDDNGKKTINQKDERGGRQSRVQ